MSQRIAKVVTFNARASFMSATQRAFIALTAFVGGALPLRAETILVPESVATIGEAIDQAQDGDVIEIAKGKYTEDLVFDVEKSFVLSGRGPVVLDGSINATMFDRLIVIGFDVQGETSINGGGEFESIDCTFREILGISASDVRLSRCEVLGGMGLSSASTEIFDTRLHGTFYASDSGRLLISGCSTRWVDLVLILASHIEIRETKIRSSTVPRLVALEPAGAEPSAVILSDCVIVIKDAGELGIELGPGADDRHVDVVRNRIVSAAQSFRFITIRNLSLEPESAFTGGLQLDISENFISGYTGLVSVETSGSHPQATGRALGNSRKRTGPFPVPVVSDQAIGLSADFLVVGNTPF